ncbi:MAG: YukJ family protein [Segetibacter sp.]
MSLQNYGVLVGSITNALDSPAAVQKNPGSKPHFQILVKANNTQYRIAVNVKSDQQPSDLQFYLDDNYKHPILDDLKELPVGFSKLLNKPNTPALDYIRGNLFDFNDMRIVPSILGGPNNDLNDILNLHVQHAIDTTGALVYAFGSRWGPEPDKKDAYFDFLPGNGIHDIHMNQGNIGTHARDNGIYSSQGIN